MIEVERFSADMHLEGVIRLCDAEGWPSLPADPIRASRVLTAPGVTTVVAVEERTVVGFAELLSDGELQAYLALVAVDAGRRGEGIGRRLVGEVLAIAGGERVDLLTDDASLGFYRTFPHFEKTGFRLYPFYDNDPSPQQ